MIALCYEQTPKRSMFPFSIMLQILKNRYISFDCEMSLVIACQIYLLNETWLHSQSGIIFSNEDSKFHSLSHNIIWLQKTWNSTQCICNTSILCFGQFFYNTLLSLYIYLPVMCVILLILYLSNVWKHIFYIYIFKWSLTKSECMCSKIQKKTTLILWNSITI